MIVVITGGSKGLGKSIAESFASEGNTILLCARNEFTLYHTVEYLQTNYPHSIIKAIPADLSRREDINLFADWCLKSGAPDILVNNAGAFIPGSVFNEPEGALEELLSANLFSAYHLTRALLPEMMKNKKGHIFTLCSIAALKAYKNGGAYSISKFALAGFTKNLREEMKPYNIKVTGIYPGATYTDSWKESGLDASRFMQPNDIAQMVLAASKLSPASCVEEIILRPLPGDI